MRSILHISTRPDPEVTHLIEAQKADAGVDVQVIEVHDTDVDYDKLLDQIFAADSVQVW